MNHPDIVGRLSSSQDRRDQGPNRELAQELSATQDTESIQKLIDLLQERPQRPLENDILLCLAHLSEIAPGLVAAHCASILPFISSKTNRAIWGAMITLGNISSMCLPQLYEQLPLILKAMDEGTVVTRDHGFVILLSLYASDQYRSDSLSLIFEQLYNAPDNQLGQYSEKFERIVQFESLQELADILSQRQPYLEKEAHKKRIGKLLKKINQRIIKQNG